MLLSLGNKKRLGHEGTKPLRFTKDNAHNIVQ